MEWKISSECSSCKTRCDDDGKPKCSCMKIHDIGLGSMIIIACLWFAYAFYKGVMDVFMR